MALSGIGSTPSFSYTSWQFPAKNNAEEAAPDKNAAQKQQEAEKQRVVTELRQRDAEVRQHEQAHMAAAGGLSIGGASYEMQVGPDGKSYAVGGEVSIDTAAVSGDPEATLRKAETIRSAALAPANPSSQDMKVAAQATQMQANAQRELAEQKAAERQERQGVAGYTQHGIAATPPMTLGLNVVA